VNIDQALIALCRKHDLTSLSVQAQISHQRASGFAFTTFAHCAMRGEDICRFATEATASEAIAHAIQQVNEVRACVVDVPDMELEIEP